MSTLKAGRDPPEILSSCWLKDPHLHSMTKFITTLYSLIGKKKIIMDICEHGGFLRTGVRGTVIVLDLL